MFTFKVVFHDSGEVLTSVAYYKYPHTAMAAAKRFLKGRLKYNQSQPMDIVSVFIYDVLGNEVVERRRTNVAIDKIT